MKKKIYLVTGAAGFIGSNLAKKLISLGNEVWTIDNLSTGVIENLPNKIKFVNGNCSDDNSLSKLKNLKFNAIFHYAGQSSGEISFDNPSEDIQSNVISTIKLLEYSVKNKVKNFIYGSSMGVYGNQKILPVKENYHCKPNSFYGVGKLASENYLNIFGKEKVKTISLRLFNVYGPNQNLKNMKQGMVSIFLSQALKSKEIVVQGDKKRFRDFIYIDDVIDLNLKIIQKIGKYKNVYNVGTGKKTTVEELLKIILQYFPEKKLIYKDSTKGDIYGIYSNIDSTIETFNWHPKINLDKGIKKFFKKVMNKGYEESH